MRHLISGKKLSRDSDHRQALRRNLAAALFIHNRIKTTVAKAKFVRPFVEKIITLARKGDLRARQRVIALLQDRFIVNAEETDVKRNKSFKVVKAPKLIHKLFAEIAPKYADRDGGYTRLILLSKRRLGDNGQVVYLELVDPEEEKKTKRTRTGGNRRKKAQMREQFYSSLIKAAKKGEETAEAQAPAETPQAQDEPPPEGQAQGGHAAQPGDATSERENPDGT